MYRFVLPLKNGFSIVDEDRWGRYIGNDGRAFDLDGDRHSELIQQTMEKGERCVAAGSGIKKKVRRSIQL
ncbi:hypothetical protein KKF82_05835 [Patescibacteria group bacterium]|nr:hypothetical protein [Patescibacteria group bacterium]